MTSSPLLEIDHITVTVLPLAVTLTVERGLATMQGCKMFLDRGLTNICKEYSREVWGHAPSGKFSYFYALKSILVRSEIESKLDSNSIQLESW